MVWFMFLLVVSHVSTCELRYDFTLLRNFAVWDWFWKMLLKNYFIFRFIEHLVLFVESQQWIRKFGFV